MNYAKLAFTEAVKDLQAQNGSRNGYDRMEKQHVVDGLANNEMAFIEDRDSFYMASFGENGYPYIQHRGGPKGFVKVLDDKTIGVVDFSGNKQYISMGNVQTNPRVSLIMVSYPQKARLKLYADVRVVQLDEDKALFDLLDPADYQHRPERMLIFDIKAFDWNCPQHITPRYTLEEIQQAFAAQQEHLGNLEAEVQNLREQVRQQAQASPAR